MIGFVVDDREETVVVRVNRVDGVRNGPVGEKLREGDAEVVVVPTFREIKLDRANACKIVTVPRHATDGRRDFLHLPNHPKPTAPRGRLFPTMNYSSGFLRSKCPKLSMLSRIAVNPAQCAGSASTSCRISSSEL